MRLSSPFLFTLFLFCLRLGLEAQITVSPSHGCGPPGTGINNASFVYSGPAATGLTWNFGDGSPTSNLLSPQHSYLSIGSYTVVCTAIISGSPQNFTFLVVVDPSPSGNINSVVLDPSGCAPRNATLSASGSNPNYVYTWAFGDNTVGSGSVAVHSYLFPGSFNPNVTISDPQIPLCSAYYSWTVSAINVSGPHNLIILSNPGTFSCAAPFTTAFSSSTSVSGSPLGGSLTFNWNFGNSQTGTGPNPPPVTYNTSNFYTVTLSATDNNNCTNTITTQVSLMMPTVSATVPAAVCVTPQMPIFLPPTASPWWPYFAGSVVSSQTTSYWNMGDGSPTIQFPNPNNPPPYQTALIPNTVYTRSLHTYATPGLKIGTVSVYAGTCVATQTFAIFVEQIIPNFTTVPQFTCGPTIVANYTNLSTTNFTTPLSYTWITQQWNPNYGTTVVATNPTFTFTQGSTNPYTIYDTYAPDMYLYVSSGLNCGTYTHAVIDSIRRPTAFFNKTFREGCAPLVVTFSDSSFTSTNVFPITSYTWNSGTSPPFVVSGVVPLPPSPASVIPNFTYTYTTPGIYHPFLQIQTQGGCTSNSFTDEITVVNPPQIAVSLTPNLSVCAGQPVQVNLTSTSNPAPQFVHIESGDNYFSGCVTDYHPTWAYHSPGIYGFTLSASLNSCTNTAVSAQTIQVKGPAAAMRYTTSCTNKMNVDFTFALRDAQTATVNYGAGPSNSISLLGIPGNTTGTNTSFLYPASGDYTASIVGRNTLNACPDYTQSMIVTVRQPSASFESPAVICSGTTAIFTVNVVPDNLIACGQGYTWLFNNDPPLVTSNSLFPGLFNTVGIQTITLRVKDVNGCEDRSTFFLRVANPVPTFTFNSNPICFSQYPVQLVNQTPQTPDAVSQFTWMYGPPLNQQAFPQSTTAVNSTATQTYNFPIGAAPTQTFDVKLIAKDDIGCVDSIRHKVVVSNPKAILLNLHYACIPTGSVNYVIMGQPTYTNYFLNFDDGTAPVNTTNTLVTGNYTQAGVYHPTLVVTDNQGCTAQTTSTVEVQTYPVSDFTFQTSTGIQGTTFCKQQGSAVTITLASTSTTAYPVYYMWDLGIPPPIPAGTNSTAGTSYSAAGSYTLKLSLIPNAPCIHTKSVVINIYDQPTAEAVVDKNVFCMGETIVVSMVNDSAVHHWQWDFGDNQPTPTYSVPFGPTSVGYNYQPGYFPAASNGSLLIILTFASPSDACKNIDTINVKMIRVLADFDRNDELDISDYAHCLGSMDTFSNTTLSNASSLTYTWNFGDGGVSYIASPSHSYVASGTYSVILLAKDPNVGCTSMASKTMTLYALPTVSFSIDSLACPDSLFTILGSGTPGESGNLTGTLSSPQMSYSLSFDPSNTFSFQTTAPATTIYTLSVTDGNGCRNYPVTDTIHIQAAPPAINTSTTIIIGQTVTVNGYVGGNYTYNWAPDTLGLSCTNCYNPVSNVTANIVYTVNITDLPLQCYQATNTHTVIVLLKASLDVPTAFTPNNDGINDFILPGGWGIRKLNYFKVFNRWGQLLFESTDKDRGWDGNFNGVPQNMETYIYQASVETYTDETLTKSGSFKLIR